MAIAPDVLLKGAWFSMEQSGLLLRDAVILYEAKSYASAAGLALLAREETGKYRILFDLWCKVAVEGEKLTEGDVRAACKNHVVKQDKAQISTTRFTPKCDLPTR